jgi:transposase-like protein
MTKKIYRVAPEIKADILKRIKDDGVTVSQAAEQHGLSEKTIYNWLSKGAESGPTWREFNKLKKEKEQLLAMVGELTIKLSATQKKT